MSETSTTTARVRDIMSTEVFTVAASTSVDDAARSLTYHKISGAPVVHQGRIVGVVSNTDLVNPRYRATTEAPVTVGEAMTRIVYAVRPEDVVMAAVRLMVNENIHRVVVVNELGKLMGMVTPMDVMKALVEGLPIQERAEEPRHAEPALAIQYVDLRLSDPSN